MWPSQSEYRLTSDTFLRLCFQFYFRLEHFFSLPFFGFLDVEKMWWRDFIASRMLDYGLRDDVIRAAGLRFDSERVAGCIRKIMLSSGPNGISPFSKIKCYTQNQAINRCYPAWGAIRSWFSGNSERNRRRREMMRTVEWWSGCCCWHKAPRSSAPIKARNMTFSLPTNVCVTFYDSHLIFILVVTLLFFNLSQGDALI